MSHIYLSTPIDSQQWHQELDALLGLSSFFTEVWVAPEQPRALITTQVHTALYYLVAEYQAPDTLRVSLHPSEDPPPTEQVAPALNLLARHFLKRPGARVINHTLGHYADLS